MTEAKKGFRQAPQPTKGEVVQENNELKTQFAKVQQTLQAIMQQLVKTMQEQTHLSNEVKALAELARVSETTEVKNDDLVMIDAVGTLKETGKLFNGGTLRGTVVRVGSKGFVDGFEDGLIGMKVGETKDIEIVFPETYHVAELQNQTAVFRVLVVKNWTAAPYDNALSPYYSELLEADKKASEEANQQKGSEDAQAQTETASAPQQA